jgi:hypothetical protein
MLLRLADRVFAGKLSATAMTFAVLAYERGDHRQGGRMMRIASGAAPEDAGLQAYGADIAAKAGDHRVALRLGERALRLKPEHPDLVALVAFAQREVGDAAGALERCERAMASIRDRDPGFPLMMLLSQLRMPGPGYLEALRTAHEVLRPRTYLEIGVASGDSIVLVRPGTLAIGVDPAPDIRHPLPAGTRIFSQTSDAFFEQNDPAALFGGLPVDLAFIDGMHLFEFALRDFINTEKCCAAGSTILLDDCWPLERRSAERERRTQFWTGDVWRILPALRKYRPGLRIHTIATAPGGQCVVRGLEPQSRVLKENYDRIVAEFGALDFAEFENNRDAYLQPCANDPESIRGVLS